MEFRITGEPVSKGRARTTVRGSYTPERTRVAEEAVGWAYRAGGGRRAPATALIRVDAKFVLGVRRRRDVDNMLKLVLDALNGVAYDDDSQVVMIHASKRWTEPGEVAHSVITVTVL